jgi:hypothetical protein
LTAAASVLTAPFVAALEPDALAFVAAAAAGAGVELPPPPPQPVNETASNNPVNHILLLNLFRIVLSPVSIGFKPCWLVIEYFCDYRAEIKLYVITTQPADSKVKKQFRFRH